MALQIAGIDIAQALSRLANNEGLLTRLLKMFYKDNNAIAASLIDMYERQDWDALEKATHNLKGVAGNVSAIQLFEAAKAFDDALRSTPPDTSRANLDAMLTELDILLKGIEQGIDLSS